MKLISIIEAADTFLLEKVFQKFSNFFQKTTGKNCFFLARLALIMTSSTMITAVIAMPEKNFYFLCCILLSSAYSLIVWIHIMLIEKKERWFFEKGEFENPGKVSMFPSRMFALVIMLTVAIYAFHGKSWNQSSLFIKMNTVFNVAWIYFASCTPLPPVKGQLDKWAGFFRRKERSALCPAKECHHV